ILGVFSTGPFIPNTGWNIVSEAIATFILVFAIKGMAQVGGMNGLQGNVAVFVIIMACGMSTGGTTGYAMNPARDLGPRLAHACLPIPNKGSSNWGYAIVPIVGPIIGALIAVGVYAIIPWA
ncbi:MAG: MIP/aquaporin family protein, partial [Lachnospiraceae bacterium]